MSEALWQRLIFIASLILKQSNDLGSILALFHSWGPKQIRVKKKVTEYIGIELKESESKVMGLIFSCLDAEIQQHKYHMRRENGKCMFYRHIFLTSGALYNNFNFW